MWTLARALRGSRPTPTWLNHAADDSGRKLMFASYAAIHASVTVQASGIPDASTKR
jgi:hypothetical protein